MMMTFMGCPGEEDCNDLASNARIPDLVTISPLKTTYKQGDEIILSLTIPSENNYFGTTVDIFKATGDNNPLAYGDDNLFIDNQVLVTTGNQGKYSNQFHLKLVDHNYVLEVRIILNRLGYYNHDGIYIINFQGDSYCNRFFIKTNILGVDYDYRIEFEVTE
ncbi:MAG: hypothetical protein ACPF88_06220 [Flavobacteriaceae bacterium]